MAQEYKWYTIEDILTITTGIMLCDTEEKVRPDGSVRLERSSPMRGAVDIATFLSGVNCDGTAKGTFNAKALVAVRDQITKSLREQCPWTNDVQFPGDTTKNYPPTYCKGWVSTLKPIYGEWHLLKGHKLN